MTPPAAPSPCWTTTPGSDIQTPFDVAVVIPTTLRPSLLQAVRSIFTQDLAGRIQILLGIDRRTGSPGILDQLRGECPPNMAITVCDPGYSTARHHGGLYSAVSGGSLRTALSYLANSPLLAYLDDDNWWAPDHLSSLRQAIEGVGWAWSYRWLVDAADDRPITIDKWDSAGPGRGVFAHALGGLVDTNCLMIDKLRADDVLWLWSHGMLRRGQGNDRRVFRALLEREPCRCSEKATAYYRIEFDRQKELAQRLQAPPPEPPPTPHLSLANLMRAVHTVSPYAGVSETGDKISEPAPHAGITELVERLNPQAIVDLCEGDTTAAFRLARASCARNPQSLTVAVDTFLPRFTPERLQAARQAKKSPGAYGEDFARFRSAVVSAGLGHHLLPLPQETFAAAWLLRTAQAALDLIRVPWSGDEARWHASLRAFWPLLRRGGVAFVEFYTPELFLVVRGIQVFARERNLEVHTIGPESERLLMIIKTEAQPLPANK